MRLITLDTQRSPSMLRRSVPWHAIFEPRTMRGFRFAATEISAWAGSAESFK